jgi:hypothetical protein
LRERKAIIISAGITGPWKTLSPEATPLRRTQPKLRRQLQFGSPPQAFLLRVEHEVTVLILRRGDNFLDFFADFFVLKKNLYFAPTIDIY